MVGINGYLKGSILCKINGGTATLVGAITMKTNSTSNITINPSDDFQFSDGLNLSLEAIVQGTSIYNYQYNLTSGNGNLYLQLPGLGYGSTIVLDGNTVPINQ